MFIKGESFRLKEKLKAGLLNLNSIAWRRHERDGIYAERRGGTPPRAPPAQLNPVGEFQMINVGDFRMIIDTPLPPMQIRGDGWDHRRLELLRFLF
jgi:hypothetical protein